MNTNVPFSTFLGKYHTELLYSTAQEKYQESGIDNLFEQRFQNQTNKMQMIVDPSIEGLTLVVSGNEILISKTMFDHPSFKISNTAEKELNINPKSFYNPEIFSTLAYLACNNHCIIQIIDEIDEPIYIKFTCDCETFYSSVTHFQINPGIEVEIIEEIESKSTVNSVINYLVYHGSILKLSTFYKNTSASNSIVYRNITLEDSAKYQHMVFGRGSSICVDENKIKFGNNSSAELLGLVNSNSKNFHSIVYAEPDSPNYDISINYKDIISGNGKITFFPALLGKDVSSDLAFINVSRVIFEEIPDEEKKSVIENYVKDIADRAILERMSGVKRFYDNKSRFMNFT